LLLACDFASRYTSEEKFYMGKEYIDGVQELCKDVAKELFNAKYVDLRMISGHIADLTFLVTYNLRNDTILCLSPEDGGYPGISKEALPRILGINVEYFPFDKEDFEIKVEDTVEMLYRVRPKSVIFGASLFLYPHPVKKISKVAKEIGAVVGYDASHVLGLIAGKQFQDPLREGAEVMFGSTHKTFFGPQGGIILSDSRDEFTKTIHPSIVDNAHYNRIAALAMALLEMSEFGESYANQIIKNSKKLGKALLEFDLPVQGKKEIITESHQVLLSPKEYQKNSEFARELEKVNIITDCGIRLGVNEVTRIGMKENEMEKIAELIYRVYKGDDKEEIKREVIKLKSDFDEIEYSFKEIEPFDFLKSFFINI